MQAKWICARSICKYRGLLQHSSCPSDSILEGDGDDTTALKQGNYGQNSGIYIKTMPKIAFGLHQSWLNKVRLYCV